MLSFLRWVIRILESCCYCRMAAWTSLYINNAALGSCHDGAQVSLWLAFRSAPCVANLIQWQLCPDKWWCTAILRVHLPVLQHLCFVLKGSEGCDKSASCSLRLASLIFFVCYVLYCDLPILMLPELFRRMEHATRVCSVKFLDHMWRLNTSKGMHTHVM